MSGKPVKWVNLSDFVGKNNKPITKIREITPKQYASLAKYAPILEEFFSTPEGQEIAKREGWTFRQKLTEAFRIINEKEDNVT